MYIDQRVLPAMADEEAVYLHRYRQIRLPFVRTIEHHRRMMERREIEPTEVDIPIGLLVGNSDTFTERRRTERRNA